MSIRKMISNTWAVAAGAVLLIAACEENVRLKSQEDKLAYSIGYSMGKNIEATLEQAGDNPSIDHLLEGIRAAMQGSSDVMSEEEMLSILSEHQKVTEERAKQQAEAAAAQALNDGNAYLDANRQKPDVMALPSGLQYKVLAKGDGPRATINETVRAHYVGRFIDGQEFSRSEDPIDFPLKGVIAGWQEALQLMPSGSKWEVTVPSELAYGEKGLPQMGIPPNSTLVYDIDLIGIIGKTIK